MSKRSAKVEQVLVEVAIDIPYGCIQLFITIFGKESDWTTPRTETLKDRNFVRAPLALRLHFGVKG